MTATVADGDALDGLCEAIRAAVSRDLSAKSKMSAQHTPRASGIDKCARSMQLNIIRWESMRPFDAHVTARLERGREIEERIVIPRLHAMGFSVIAGQQAIAIKSRDGQRTICTGHAEGLLMFHGERCVFDVKSMHPNLWGRVRDGPDGLHDMLDNKFMYKYPWQILLYMYQHETEYGLFICDDCLGHWKLVPIRLSENLQRCEEALTRCEQVANAVRDGTELGFIDDPSHCKQCRHFESGNCMPPLLHQGAQVIADAELLDNLARLEELKEPADEYRRLDDEVRNSLKDRPEGVYSAGDFMVTRENRVQRRKAQDARDTTVRYVKWVRV